MYMYINYIIPIVFLLIVVILRFTGYDYMNTYITIILFVLPLILTIIGFVGSYIVGNDCGSSHGNIGNVGNCTGINNTLSWMKWSMIIYVAMIPVIIMSFPYLLGGLLLGSLFSKKPANTSNAVAKTVNSNNSNNNLNIKAKRG